MTVMRHPRFVKTMSKHGYRFVAPVVVGDATTDDGSRATAPSADGQSAAGPRSAIVVLPFTNMSGDPENEYLCDGLAEELINALTRVDGLQVMAHSSSFSFKGRNVDAREIGRQLQVGTILEGSVRKAGDRLRVSAQLIDAAGGYHLWSEQYDHRFADVFAIEDEITQAILASLQVESLEDSRMPLIARSTADMDAYSLYLQGRAFWHRRYGGFIQRAMDCFGRAIARDPGFALAYTGLADSLSSLGIWGVPRACDAFPKAAALADTAARLEPSLAEAHASRALVRLFWDWEWDESGRGFARAVALNPGNALIRLWYGHYLTIVGRMDEAIAEVRCSQALDPVSPVCSANVGWTYYLAGRQDEAARELQRVLSREPENGIALFYLAYVLFEMQRYEEGIEALRKVQRVLPGLPWVAEGIALGHGVMGNRAAAVAALDEARVRLATGGTLWSALALVHLGLGQDAEVLECLERAVDDRDVLLPWMKFMPAFGRLRTTPRFEAMLARLGLQGAPAPPVSS
jgi:TolB-like protein/Flp pilus assembly protein TadD